MDTEIREQPVLSRDNRFPYCLELTRINDDDEVVAADGLTVTAFLATTRGGAAIANTQKSLTERSGADGTYAAELEGEYVNDVLDLGLPGYWACYAIAGQVLSIWVPVAVEKYRTAA